MGTANNGHCSGFDRYTVIIEPDRDEAEWWAGGPSVVRGADGRFYLAARMREGDSPRGFRGYEVRLMAGDDGRRFEKVHSIKRESVNIGGFERPALVIHPDTGQFRLYLCAPMKQHDNFWGIFRLDDASDLSALDAATIRPVLEPTAPRGPYGQRVGFKDPTVFHDGQRWHMWVIGYDSVERTYHFVSDDGDRWQADANNPVLDAGGWHNFYTRPACVVAAAVGYFFVYEGSSHDWFDPGYNISTGLGHTLDLSRIIDLTPDAPLVRSTTPGDYHTWRYSSWVPVGDEFFVYAEAARPNNTNETRLFVLGRSALKT